MQQIIQRFCEEKEDLGFEVKKSICMFALMIASITSDVNFMKDLFSSGVMSTVADVMSSSIDEFALPALDILGKMFCFLKNANAITQEIDDFYSGEMMALLNDLVVSDDEALCEKAEKLQELIQQS